MRTDRFFRKASPASDTGNDKEQKRADTDKKLSEASKIKRQRAMRKQMQTKRTPKADGY